MLHVTTACYPDHRHLEELVGVAEVMPMVNQVELHTRLAQPKLRQWCAEHSVVVTAYSPLSGADLADPVRFPVPHPRQELALYRDFLVRWRDYCIISTMIGSSSRCGQVIAKIADSHHVDPAAVVLRWLRQHGCVVLPKSLTPHRIADNLKRPRTFVLSEEEMSLLVRNFCRYALCRPLFARLALFSRCRSREVR
jgi:diketogulonate reductase-like aldo/keto reductase